MDDKIFGNHIDLRLIREVSLQYFKFKQIESVGVICNFFKINRYSKVNSIVVVYIKVIFKDRNMKLK